MLYCAMKERKMHFKKWFYRRWYSFAVWVEYARPEFLDFQLRCMLYILKIRNKFFTKANTNNKEYIQETMDIYNSRYVNWNKMVFINNPESDIFANWYKFISLLIFTS